jgi:cytochrome c biogenesis protein CcmG/thiol:disulfide interchange protein DsbE
MTLLRPRLFSAILLLGLLVLVPTGCAVQAGPAPAWNLKDLDGKSVQLSDFKGKVVILDFWATWCPPCRAEIPNFVQLQTQYKDKGLVVVGISVDEGGPAVVSAFAKAQNINYPIVMGDESVSTAYGNIQAIPTTFVIDPSGNIVNRHEGFTEKSTFESEIQKLLPTTTASNP